jgi:hypothetical protein
MGQQHPGRAFRWGATIFALGLSACAMPEGGGNDEAEVVDVESMVSELGGECRAACGERLEAIAEQCRDEGVEPRRCHARLAEARERCAEACHVREPRDERPHACEARCGAQAHEGLRACLADDGDPRECAEAARDANEACREEHCGERPEHPRCEDSCAARARAVTQQCIEHGGDERACHRRGEEIGQRCVAEQCEPAHEEQGACAERCGAEGRRQDAECREAGNDERACRERAAHFVAACIQERCEDHRPPPPPPEQPVCEERCGAEGRNAYAECVEAGGGEDRCAARARELVGTCVAEHCERGGDEPPPAEPTCEERCGAEGRRVNQECVEGGGGEDRCLARAREFVGTCIADHCERGGDEPPPAEPTCEERCGAEGRRLNQECLEAGGGADACAVRTREFVGTCVRRCDGGDEPPPPPPEEPTCEQRCQAGNEAFIRECLAAGNGADRCRGAAAERLQQCTAACGHDEPPPPPPEDGPTCADRCEIDANAAFQQCVAAGHDEAACREQRTRSIRACIAEHCER